MNSSPGLYYVISLASILCIVLFFSVRTLKMLKKKRLWATCRNGFYSLFALFLLMTAALVATNLLTYHRLTYESALASVQIEKISYQQYNVIFTPRSNCKKTTYVLAGDEWQVDARILKWHGWANLLGMDSHFQLDRISGRYHDIEQQSSHLPTVFVLEKQQNYDLWSLKKKYQWLPWLDARYGQSVFMPMKNGQIYQIYMTQSGMIARVSNKSEADCKHTQS